MNNSLEIKIVAIPEREKSVQYIKNKMQLAEGDTFEVFYDYDHNGPVWNTERVLKSVKSNHVLMCTDDILICKNFVPIVKMLRNMMPTELISFYGNHHTMKKILEKGEHWFKYYGGTWNYSMLLPRYFIDEYLKFQEEYIPKDYPHDDRKLCYFGELFNIPTYITIPSLVQHNPELKSSIGHNSMVSRSKYFIGEDGDPFSIDWHEGLENPTQFRKKPNGMEKYLAKRGLKYGEPLNQD